MKTSLIHYPEKLSPSSQGDAADNIHEYTSPFRKINLILVCAQGPPGSAPPSFPFPPVS